MEILTVKNLCKHYDSFSLNNVSFSIKAGSITGFIGRNGAGKTTTLKSLLNFVHADSGEILFFGNAFEKNELTIKRNIGFVSGGIDYYPHKKLRTITNVTKRFYPKWDESAYRHYLSQFHLDENKTPNELSAGMKVKYSLALALSHHATLLLLDEPTSGLDPVSRDDLLHIFLTLVEGGNISILFSTHITSDLEKCADSIIYIKNGEILAQADIDTFLATYKVVTLGKEQLTPALKRHLIGCQKEKNGYSALIKTSILPLNGLVTKEADLESVMVHLEKEETL